MVCSANSDPIQSILGLVERKLRMDKVKFVLPLKPREKRQFSYEVTTNFESNASR